MKRTSGFTLIELTVVTAVVLVLAAILLPALVRVNDANPRASHVNGFQQLSRMMRVYPVQLPQPVVPESAALEAATLEVAAD